MNQYQVVADVRLMMLFTRLPIMIFFILLKRCVCGITIFLPNDEKLVLIDGMVPIVLIYSSSTDDLLQ